MNKKNTILAILIINFILISSMVTVNAAPLYSYKTFYQDATTIVYSSSPYFNSTTYYSSGSYSGTLTAVGQPYVSSGSAPVYKDITYEVSRNASSSFNDTYYYSDGTYSGTLTRNGEITSGYEYSTAYGTASIQAGYIVTCISSGGKVANPDSAKYTFDANNPKTWPWNEGHSVWSDETLLSYGNSKVSSGFSVTWDGDNISKVSYSGGSWDATASYSSSGITTTRQNRYSLNPGNGYTPPKDGQTSLVRTDTHNYSLKADLSRKAYYLNYSGTVATADTRIYAQKYTGTTSYTREDKLDSTAGVTNKTFNLNSEEENEVYITLTNTGTLNWNRNSNIKLLNLTEGLGYGTKYELPNSIYVGDSYTFDLIIPATTKVRTYNLKFTMIQENDDGTYTEFGEVWNNTLNINDIKPPILSLSTDYRYWSKDPVIIDVTVTDTGGSGVKGYVYTLTKDGVDQPEVTVNSSTGRITLDKSGRYKLKATGYDNAGNSSYPETGDYMVDIDGPEVTVTPMPTGKWQQYVYAEINISDNHSGTYGGRYRVTKNGLNYDSGTMNQIKTVQLAGVGKYKIYVDAEDSLGNETNFVTDEYLIDSQAPSLDFVTDIKTTWSKPTTVTMKAYDAHSGFNRIEYNFIKVGEYSNPYTTTDSTKTVSLSTTGRYYLEATVYDNAENKGVYTSEYYSIDADGPKVEFSGSQYGTSYTNIQAYVYDNHSGLASFKYYITKDGVDGQLMQGSGSTINHRVSEVGKYTITVIATDKLGNESTSKSNYYIIDNTPPKVTFSPVADDTWMNGVVDITVTDEESGISAATYHIYQGGSEETNVNIYNGKARVYITEHYQAITVVATDKAGNYTNAFSGYYKIDNIKPTISYTTPKSTDWSPDSFGISFSIGDAESGLARYELNVYRNGSLYETKYKEYTTDTKTDSIYKSYFYEGVYSATMTVVDKAGNVSTLTTDTYKVDSNRPTVTFNPVGDGSWKKSTTVGITVADTASGIKSASYTLNKNGVAGTPVTITGGVANVQLLVNAEFTIDVTATDNAGNTVTTRSGIYKIDSIAPTISFSANANSNSWTKNTITLAYTIEDIHSAINRYEYTIIKNDVEGTPIVVNKSDLIVTSSTSSISLTETGQYKLKITAYDNAGNYTTSTSPLYKVDKDVPNVSFSPVGGDNWYNTSKDISLTITDSGGSSLKAVSYIVTKDGVAGTPVNMNSGFGTVSLTGNGVYSIDVTASDYAGNTITVNSGEYKIDKLPPELSFSSTGSSVNWNKSDVNLYINMSDNDSGISRYEYILVTDGVKGAPTSYTVPPTNNKLKTALYSFTSNGEYRLIVSVYDLAGNMTSYSSDIYRVDKTSPTVAFSPNGTSSWTNLSQNINITVSDTGGSNLKESSYTLIKNGVESQSVAMTNGVASINLSEDGVYVVKVTSTDFAGNTSVTSSNQYKIDRTNPTGVYSINSSDWVNKDLSVDFSPSDTGSGVAYWRYCLSTDNGTTWEGWTTVNSPSAKAIVISTSSEYNKIKTVVVDNAGNMSTITSGVYKIDKELPFGSFNPYDQATLNNWYKTIDVKFTPGDSLSGVLSWRYRQSSDGGITWGAYTNVNSSSYSNVSVSAESSMNIIETEVTDKAGNKATFTSGRYKVDRTNPTASFNSSYKSGWTNSNIQVDITVDDTTSGVKSWKYRQSSNSGTTWGAWSSNVTGLSTSLTISTEGSNVIQVEVYDNAGNVNTVNSISYNIDKTAPTGTIADTYYENTTILNMSSSTVRDNLSGVNKVYVEYINADNMTPIQNQDFSLSASTYFHSCNLINLNSDVAKYRVNVYAVDNATNKALLFTKEILIFKIEAKATRTLTVVDGLTSYYGGDKSQLNIKVYGSADNLDIKFPQEFVAKNSIDKINTELNKSITDFRPSINTNTIIRKTSYGADIDYFFFVPTEVNSGNYTVQVTGDKGVIVKQSFVDIDVIDKSTKSTLKTIIISPGR